MPCSISPGYTSVVYRCPICDHDYKKASGLILYSNFFTSINLGKTACDGQRIALELLEHVAAEFARAVAAGHSSVNDSRVIHHPLYNPKT